MNEENRDRDQQKEFQNTVSLEPKIVVDYVNKAFIKSKNFDEEKEIEMSLPESPASPETMRGMHFDFLYRNTMSNVGA